MGGTRPRVMVIEDDADIAAAIACMLEDEGLTTILAANGREAIDKLSSDDIRPDVILLDLMMPVMDGWEFRAEQRRDPALEDIPVVLLSARNDVDATAKELAAKSW